MRLLDRILGRPLATKDQEERRVGVWEGIPMLGLDALGSSAYGPEAALTVLLPLGAAASGFAPPIIFAITALLLIVFFSYRQTIAAYPNGGGSYTVASENLGHGAGVVAAAALILDYILNAAVGISAGVGALVSAAPALHPHTLSICLAILVLLVLVNLRGVRESGVVLALPTYLFLLTITVVLVLGIWKAVTSGGHPQPAAHLHRPEAATVSVGWWLILRAFASGCTAMTGVEAVSNGVQAFREPRTVNAQRTLTALVVSLAVLLVGITILTRAYGIVATDPGSKHYQSVISQLVGAVVGRGWFYYVTMGSTLAILALSANTSFAGFPRLCRLLALDQYLPAAFAGLGRRLVYSAGIVVLAAFAAILLIVFGGVTDRLIPLFAIGALLAFTMSQAGMVKHGARKDSPSGGRNRWVNLVGAICTGIALVIVLAAKFKEGAWISILLIAAMIWLFLGVRRHYRFIDREISCDEPLTAEHVKSPIVIVPVLSWTKVSKKALRFALSISEEVEALHISVDDEEEKDIRDKWRSYVEQPMQSERCPIPKLEVVRSPYRRLSGPLLATLKRIQHDHPDRNVAVVIPEMVEARWYQYLLHNQRATILKAALLVRGGGRVVVMNVPWYVGKQN